MKKPRFPIVGIGASAGGLEAFSALLARLPTDTGMGFVLVQHLDPQHESALTQLLARATTMPVQEVTDGLRVEPDHVYVIPRNTNLGIAGGVLTLAPRPNTRAPHRSIDFFLEALAADQRALAIGVILSGTATDGTLGLEAIKAEGGITFAQDESARYDSMPRSAVAAGCVDAVLSPEQIADEIARIARHPHVGRTREERVTPAEADSAPATAHEVDDRSDEEGFKKILLLLRNHSGVDFSLYKSSTIQRRITRRLILTKHDTTERYAQFLRGNAHELDALYSDVLISVTSFFRNPDAFDVLQRKVFPALFRQRGDDPIRVWVLGCSTGQEAYSVAMSFVEAVEKAPRVRQLQVFATDLNEALLDKARRGLYAKSVAQDLSAERLRRFFVEEEGGYRVSKALREMVVFARQNVISDPPFSRLDLISCRNLLIYLEPQLQRTIFPAFHYALKPGGFLYLGASESIGGFSELFEPIDKKHKIYTRKPGPAVAFRLPRKQPPADERPSAARAKGGARRMPASPGEPGDPGRSELSAQREADRVSASQFAPPAVLVNAELQILQFRGSTGAYLQPPTGKATLDVLKMARNGLLVPLRATIAKAKKDNKTVRRDNVRVEHDGTIRTVSLQVIPLKNLRERSFLIVFDEAPRQRRVGRSTEPKAGRTGRAGQSRRIGELEAELSETRDYLQALQEQHEAAAEELQASNEEVQSANEELQSINEELETSKEELESANEELTTVNEEMAARNAELNRLNSDLVNVQTSAHLAMILLDRNLAIRRFSAQAEKQFSLLAADVGRPIAGKRLGFNLPHLEPLIMDVIDSVRPAEREVQDADGRWFSMRVRPYLTIDNKVDGAVLVFVDIDALKRSERTIRAARDYAESIIATVREPMLVLTADLRIERANRAFYDTFREAPDKTLGRFIYHVGNGQWDIPELRRVLTTVLPQQRAIADFLVERSFPGLGRRVMLLNARIIHDPAHGVDAILLAFEDVTDRRRADMLGAERRRVLELIASGDPAERCLETICLGIERIDPQVRVCVLLTKDQGTRLASVTAPRLPGLPQVVRTLPGGEQWVGTCARAIASGVLGSFAEIATDTRWPREWKAVCLSLGIHAFYAAPIIVGTGAGPEGIMVLGLTEPTEPTSWQEHLAGMGTDLVASILRRERADEALRESESRYRSLLQAVTSVVWTTDATGRFVTAQPSWAEFTGQTWEQYCEFGWVDALHPDDRERVRALWKAAVAAHTFYQCSGRVWHAATGAYRYFDARAVAVLHADGSVREWVGQVSDVDDRWRAEEARARLAAIVESSEDAIISKGLDGTVTSWNAGAERLFGYTAAEALGQPVALLIPPDRLGEEEFILERLRRSEVVEPFDTVRRRQDGTLFDVSVTASPIRDSHGNLEGAAIIARDITARKRAEAALREADRHKNEFLAMLAHELRNPLAPILGSIEIIRRSKSVEGSGSVLEGTAGVDHAVDVLARQTGHMIRLVDDLLDAGRISSGKIDLRREHVELSSVVQHAVDANRPLTERREQELTVVLPPTALCVDADPTRLAQIIGNLLNNASKFTERGGHIWLTVEVSPPLVILRVRDTGVGIAPDRLQGIFDMFTQIDISLERSAVGLGIGLTLVRTLVEMHGGTVEAISPGLGQGSEFVVRLPILVEAPAPSPTPPIAPPAVRPLRILVVDDNHDAADMLAMLLNFSGHVTFTAHDGVAAVEEADRLDPDVILLDIGLPGLNGHEAARRIRERKGHGRPLLVAVTGWGQDEDRSRSREAGFDAHLVKPVDEAVLDKLLAELVPGDQPASSG